MTYAVQNIEVFMAAYAGACSGMGIAGKVPVSSDPASYKFLTSAAGAWAQAFDTAWGLQATSELDVRLVSDLSEAAWEGRQPTDPTYQIPATYIVEVAALLAAITESRVYFASIGVVPPPSGGGSGGPTDFAIFRPGLPTAAPFYATWAEIVPLVNAAAGALILYVDSSLAAAVTTSDLDGKTRLILRPALGPVGGASMRLQIGDGFHLVGLNGVQGQLEVHSATTTVPAIVFGTDLGLLFLTGGATLVLDAGASRPMIDVTPGPATLAAMRFEFASSMVTHAAGVPVIDVPAGAFLSTFYTQLGPFAQPASNAVTGAGQWIILYDASVTVPDIGGFSGTRLLFPIDQGTVQETEVDYPLARLQASAGIAITAVYPLFTAGPLPNARLLACEHETVELLASPAMTGANAQILDAFTSAGLSGVADIFTGFVGFNAPLPAFLQCDVNTATHFPNYLLTIAGDTFDNLTAGHVKSRLVVCANPRATP